MENELMKNLLRDCLYTLEIIKMKKCFFIWTIVKY